MSEPKITKVRFGRLRSFGAFENIRIEVEADVQEGDDAKELLTALQIFVEAQLGEKIMRPQVLDWENRLTQLQKETYEAQDKLNEKHRELNKLQGQIDLLEEKQP